MKNWKYLGDTFYIAGMIENLFVKKVGWQEQLANLTPHGRYKASMMW